MSFITFNVARQKFEPLGLKIVRDLERPGGYKVVYEAYDLAGRHVALKIINPDTMDYPRLLREAKAMEAIDSPFVAKVLSWDPGKEVDFPYLIEEFIEGSPLWDLMETRFNNRETYTPTETIHFLDQVLQGLLACVEKRIVHRDIKPQNIMIRSDNSPVIIDFGVARHLNETPLTSTSGPRPGITLIYAPPELINYNSKLINERTDLFSLGIVAYFMLSGQHPFVHQPPSNVDLHTQMLTFPEVPLIQIVPSIPPSLSNFITLLIKRDNVSRIPSVKMALERLRKISQD